MLLDPLRSGITYVPYPWSFSRQHAKAIQMKRKNDTSEATPVEEGSVQKRIRVPTSKEFNIEPPVYKEGDLVEATHNGSKILFEAFVTKAYTNRKYYDLLFTDGDRSANVSYQVISKVLKAGM